VEAVRKAAGIAFFLYCGLAVLFVAAYLLASTEFGLPPGPPIVAVITVALACVAVTRLARRS
jgi:FtsH-binding integral membrane protein